MASVLLDYDDIGTGDPLVLIHGHPFDRSMWQAQRERPGWRVIAPDLRGYGASPVVPGVTTLEAHARDIAALADRLQLDRFVIGGLSMGGQIVMEFHRLFPHRVRGLLFAATFATADTDAGKAARYETADRLLREGMTGYATEVLPRMLAPQTIQAQPATAEHVLTMMRSAPPEGAAAALRGRAERQDYRESLTTVTVPTLVVVGTEDTFTPVSDAELIRSLVPGATLVVVDGAAHLPNLERPKDFNAALDIFLAGLR
jgi:pimeloyl-ACP methyl ester carboxylesterase